MDKQCEDRAHRIGQIRDVHIYRFVSQHTVEEALLRKANQKRHLDDLVIQKGEFDWRSLFDNENALTSAMGEVEDTEDAVAARLAAQEESALYGADEADFGAGDADTQTLPVETEHQFDDLPVEEASSQHQEMEAEVQEEPEDAEEEGGTVDDYMLRFVEGDHEFFRSWKV